MFTQKMKKIMLTGMAVLAMGALVAGCGSDSNSGQAANGKQVIKVVLMRHLYRLNLRMKVPKI